MLSQTGDPAGQARHPGTAAAHGHRPQACRRLTVSRSRVSQQLSGLRNAATAHTASFQAAATAFAGSHGGSAPAPCAPLPPPAAAAAVAPTTTMQDLIAQVAQEESRQQYQQQPRTEQFHHQLQHHDHLLLQQQLQHLHQQQRQRQQQQRRRQQQHHEQQQQQQQEAPSEQAHHGAERQQQQQCDETEPQQLWGSAQQPQQPLQHAWQEGGQATWASDGAVQQQAVDSQVQHTASSSSSSGSSSSGSNHWPPHTSTAAGLRARTASTSSGMLPAVQPQAEHGAVSGLNNSVGRHAQRLTSSRAPINMPRRQQQQQQQAFERTSDGMPIVRVHRGSKPSQVAAVLCSCLLQEQQVMLSAAGAELALLALQCVERAVCLQQEQQPGSMLLAVPSFKSSRRPDGRGKCQLYDLVCSVQPAGLLQEQQLEQRQPEQQQQQQQQEQEPGTEAHAVRIPAILSAAGSEASASPSPQQQHHEQPYWQQQPVLSPSLYAGHALASSVHSTNNMAAAGSVRARSTQLLELQPMPLPPEARHQQHQQHQPQQQWSPGLPQPRLPQLSLRGHGAVQGVTAQAVGCVRPRQLQTAHSNGNGNGRHHHYQPQQQPQAERSSQQHQQAWAGIHWPAAPASSQRYQPQLPPTAAFAQPAAAPTAPAAAGITQLKVVGASLNFADTLQDALDASPVGVVQLPVAHPKQAVRALEAVTLVSRRFQQQQQLAGSAGDSSCGMQLVMQPQRGKVWGQAGPTRGLLVFVYAAPLVQ